MTIRVSRRAFLAATTAALAAPAISRVARAADEPLLLRCSLDTSPTHLRNVSLKDYLGKVEAATGGKIKTQVYDSGQLFPDLQVGKALIQGQVEMACPGTWVITGIVPDADAFQLPILYGRTIEDVHRVTDGKAGALLGDEVKDKLRARVLGKFLDLGFQNWYSATKPLKSLADLKGMKIRNSGGAGQAWRARFVGAIPNTTAWPQVPLSLSQGVFDGFVSSNESLVSAQLWDAGVKFALEDHQFVAVYIPMIATAFWDKLSPAQQKTMSDLWAANIGTYRANMAGAQSRARGTLESHGIRFADPSPEQIAADRKRMMPEQAQLAQDLKISPEMVKLVNAAVGETS
jgi:TRAP-type C4-dicarboxylate transport system substrate-binding protein